MDHLCYHFALVRRRGSLQSSVEATVLVDAERVPSANTYEAKIGLAAGNFMGLIKL